MYTEPAYFRIEGDKVVRELPSYNIFGDVVGTMADCVMDKKTFLECLKEWGGEQHD